MLKEASPQIAQQDMSQQDSPQQDSPQQDSPQAGQEQLTEEAQTAAEPCAEDVPAEEPYIEDELTENYYAEDVPAEEPYIEDVPAENYVEDVPAEAENQEVKSSRKKRKVYWIFLLIWSILLTSVLSGALIWFYHFLEDYQNVFENTRPKLYMESVMPVFSQKETGRIVAMAEPVELGAFERTEHFTAFLDGYLAGKTIDYGTKAGEHIEERPVYVVTADGEPFAVVRLKKQEQTAAYGLPLWETGKVELLPMKTQELFLEAPSTVTVTVNGLPVTQDNLTESGIPTEAADYLADYAEIPACNRYSLGKFYQSPQIEAVNSAGESAEVTYDEQRRCYVAGWGGDSALQAEVEEYVIQVMTDYAMFVSNDSPYNALDAYFPKGSKLLAGIKKSQRQWYDNHKKPEIHNQQITSFTMYSPEAFSARVYLEQHMYVLFSKKTEIIVTDLEMYFVKQDGKWKVAGIVFE